MSKWASLVVGSMQQVTEDLEDDVDALARLPHSSTSVTLGSQSSWYLKRQKQQKAQCKGKAANGAEEIETIVASLGLPWHVSSCRCLPPMLRPTLARNLFCALSL